MVTQVELAVRVATAAVLSVLPTLCFLGLYRALERLRDDDLIDRLQARGELDPSAAAAGRLPSLHPGGRTRSVPTCEGCGAAGVTDAYCWQCADRPPEERARPTGGASARGGTPGPSRDPPGRASR